MTILNTTFVLDPSVSVAALAWIRSRFLEDGRKPMLARVQAHEPQADCETYALHLHFDSPAQACAWRDGQGAELLGQMGGLWGERVLFFQTLLDVID